MLIVSVFLCRVTDWSTCEADSRPSRRFSFVIAAGSQLAICSSDNHPAMLTDLQWQSSFVDFCRCVCFRWNNL